MPWLNYSRKGQSLLRVRKGVYYIIKSTNSKQIYLIFIGKALEDEDYKIIVFNFVKLNYLFYALVAQLDRASGYGPEGLGFKSLRAYHFFPSHLLIMRPPKSQSAPNLLP